MSEFTKGSGNIFADLGMEDSSLRLTKARIAQEINVIIKRRGWTQSQAAEILGETQNKISYLCNGQLKGFSLEKLLDFLTHLDRRIVISIEKSTKHSGLELAICN